jgi:hypothetical protein
MDILINFRKKITAMNRDDFRKSLDSDQPPSNLSIYLQAMWYDAKGNWDRAHQLVQDMENAEASWIHAYLHRKEGDIANADYWYRRAGKKLPDVSFQEEWENLVDAFL